MKLIGLMCCRNEAWVLPASLRAALQWCDELCVLIHGSPDGQGNSIKDRTIEVVSCFQAQEFKPDCLGRNDGRVQIFGPVFGGWDEADYRQLLLEEGRRRGGTHFAVIDADELLTTAAQQTIRDEASRLSPGELLRLPWIHCWRSLEQYRADDSAFGRAFVSILFADRPGLAYRAAHDGYQLHARVPTDLVRHPGGDRDGGIGVLHLQHASWRRVESKQRWYMMIELLQHPDRRSAAEIYAQYSPTLSESGLQLRDIPSHWWPVDPGLIDLEAPPWQEAECRRLIGEHGAIFGGLDEAARLTGR